MKQPVRERIVVVDDDEPTRKLLRRQLERKGYRVETVEDGRSALNPINEMGIGIVVADWNMPNMSGLELCRAVRELEQMKAVQSIYFILLTAQDRKEDVIQGLKAGANDYLTKPYHEGELLARVQVGERVLRLQTELLQRNIEVQKANAKMALLAQRLEEQARTDSLTGLPNRRHLFQRFDELWAQSDREDTPLCCIMLDVDFFKTVNDTHGHAIGDAVLERIAEIARMTSRRPDLCGRVGGEEFLILCPAVPLAAAAELADQIRRSISEHPVDCEDVSVNVTVSCGVAQKTSAIPTPDKLFQAADALLYIAKQHGRNQTWLCGADGVEQRYDQPVSAAYTASPIEDGR